MLLIREVEEQIAKKYHEQKMRCPVHLSSGQEASAVGVCYNMKKTDRVFSNHRCHAHYLAKNGNLKKMLSEIYGKYNGCCGGRGGSMHLFDRDTGIVSSVPIVSSSIPLALGSALSSKIDKTKEVTVAFLGDGSVEEGVFHESLNFASINKLPIIFVCENNLYSVYTSLKDRQPDRSPKKLGEAHNIKSYMCDGNDVLKVFKISRKLINNTRRGKGPYFLILNTYRYREHCGPNFDNKIGYRTEKEFLKWKKNDPLATFKRKLINQFGYSQSQLKKVHLKLLKSILKDFNFAEKSKLPLPSNIDEYLYV